MAYPALSAEFAKLELGKHSLLVRRPQQTSSTPLLQTTSTSPPILQTTSTSSCAGDHRIAAFCADDQQGVAVFADDPHTAFCRRPASLRQEPQQTALSSNAQFHNLMQYINCYGTCTQEAWHKQFGVISDDFPWGTDFWHGFRSLMATQYLPQSALRHTCIDAYVPSLLTLPLNFARLAAQAPKTDLNLASNNKYPCFILAYTCGHPKYEVVCIHQGLRFVRHWKVHATWLEKLQA